ncbi:1-phosphatidylinositol 4,5-bisphosphate phosphodiesterase eta-1-like isoform X2 [Eucyclogobius newberryi]|uniref:1-phosphatidylinositol 4,5-bisphosphate phosphodiesterase eta-1-like isoform X2 n=1 Tax=Eucyclogobius newberryi TaxID=166745 RepID=UPI003B5BB66A
MHCLPTPVKLLLGHSLAGSKPLPFNSGLLWTYYGRTILARVTTFYEDSPNQKVAKRHLHHICPGFTMTSRVMNQKGEPQYRRHFLTNNSIFQVERCMSVMQSGTQMVKLKAGSKGLVRLFYLDDHRSCIRWKPSRKSEKAKITIDSLYKVTEGVQSDIFHRQAEGSLDPSCCFTIYHGNHMESLDLVTSNSEEARTWVTGLRYLMAGISDEDSLARRQRTHDQWMKQTFEEADKNGDGFLNIDEVYQLLHKLNVNLPRRKVKQMFQEADTDDQQGTLTYEEFSVFYKMMSMRRDLFLLMMAYSERKDHLNTEELATFLHNEQKMTNVTPEYAAEIIEKFEDSIENKQRGILGIEGFTSFMRSPACDIFNPLHNEVNQDMEQPLCNYFIASSHNTYLTGDQLLSHSKTDMYAWVLQSGCRCVEVDCWDGPEGEPMVQHGYTLTSKIPFKSVIETINKHAFVNNQFPVILSIENHCNIQQQKKIAQYLREIFGDKLDIGHALTGDSRTLPSPQSLLGKILIKGKRLPAYLSADVEEGEVSDDDSADEIEDDFKLKSINGNGHHQVESHIRKKLDSLLKESKIGDKEDSDSFSIRALLRATHQGLQKNLRQGSKGVLKKSQSRSLITTLKQKRHSKSRLTCQSVDKEDECQEPSGRDAGGQFNRYGRKRKTMKLSRDLSNLVVFTNSVASQECLNEGTPGDVLSFSETRAQSLVNHKAEQFLAFNQRQLSRIYPSAYRIDSSNFNPQFYWNVGCQLVALNYQTEGRMMQLNQAKFMVNGGSGYVLKPPPMCKGSFNPFSEDPLPACPKKQLILKVISGQQLPKPPDSMLGDRGEIIDPFVEVEIIGLPVDCCKEQTRVVDDNGFNPVWEETLSFTLHMPEMTLVRFLVWDHDPIGRDFIGQRTVAFSSLMPGYRHVYLEGLTEASIFVHVSVHDVYGKGNQLRGIRGLFNRSSKSSVDTNTGGLRKRSISDHLLRRTASAPAKGRKKTKMPPSESVASISDQKNGLGAAAAEGGEQSTSGQETGTERRFQPRSPLIHRPMSMPLDRLLQGQLSLCSPDPEQQETGSDSGIGGALFRHLRSSSLDIPVTPTSELAIPSHSKASVSPIDPPVETSYLVIGREGGQKEADYVNYQANDIFQNKSKMATRTEEYRLLSKPETSAHNTTFTVPSVPSTSTVASVPTANMEANCQRSLHNSTISRLIDAVSLDDDTCGSISALIGKFDITADQTNFTASPNCTFSIHHQTTSSFKSPFKTTSTPNDSHRPNHLNHPTPLPSINTNPLHQKDLSSPETADLEEIYTILDEEVLLPVSSYNLNQQISSRNTPVQRSGPSPTKALNTWNSGKYTEEAEERIYEEVVDPPERIPQINTLRSNPPLSPSLQDCYASPAQNGYTELEINVDEDPLDRIMATPRYGSPWKDLTSPTKRHAIYQNNESPSKRYDPVKSYSERQQPPINKSHVSSAQCPSPVNKLPFREPARHYIQNTSRTNMSIPVHQNGYQINSDSYCRDLNRNYTQKEMNYNANKIQNMTKPEDAWQKYGEKSSLGFQYKINSSENLSRLLAASPNNCRDSVSSPNLVSTPQNYLRYNCMSPLPQSPLVHNPYLPSSRTNQSSPCSNKQFPEARFSLQTSLGLPVSQPSHKEATPPGQAKSKSLGDLTSEDISCNFKGKYHIISRSFISPTQNRTGVTTVDHFQTQSCDPLTEQLRKLVTLEGDDGGRKGPESPHQQHVNSPSAHRETSPMNVDESPPLLTRRLSSRSQSRVRNINNRARERQQEASRARGCELQNNAASSMGGVVLRNKGSMLNPPANRHSTGSYIAGYLSEMEDRGLPEGACTSLRCGNDHYRDRYYTDDTLVPPNAAQSEPEVYFLLRL